MAIKAQFPVFSSSTTQYFMEKHRDELDFLNLQNERLRTLLQEQRRSQLAMLMKITKTKLSPLMRQKEEEIAEATKRNTELKDLLRRSEMEIQKWRRLAQDNEAIIIALNTTMEELKKKTTADPSRHGNAEAAAEDAESSCEEDDGVGKVKTKKMCKACNSRRVCVLFFPCRHLCSCKTCEAFLGYCPVCGSLKKASIEALLV